MRICTHQFWQRDWSSLENESEREANGHGAREGKDAKDIIRKGE